MTVSLPVMQKAYVKSQAAASGCSTPSEYIRRLIHADQKARADDELERLLIEGLESPKREMTGADWQELKSSVLHTLADRRKLR